MEARVRVTYQGQTRSIKEWAEITGLPETTLFGRIYRRWDPELVLTAPRGGHRPPDARIPQIDPRSPWADDEVAQKLVRDNPHGMTLDEVGIAFGITRERVRQIEQRAIQKLRAAARRDYGQQAALMQLLRDDDAA